MRTAENLFLHPFRSVLLPLAALSLWLVLPGCFLFVLPEKSEQEIAPAPAGKGTLFALKSEDPRSCMHISLPSKPVRTPCPAVIIFPGGAYGVLAWEKEGEAYAEFLNRHGIAGIVVRYPLGSLFGHFKRHPSMLDTAQRAIRLIRYHAPELGIDPDRIGVMGSSAGGHLAGLTMVWESAGRKDSADPVERVPARPDFAVLCYPVVSMTAPCTHRLSCRNLAGSDPDPELLARLSLEKRITPACPPVFLWHTLEDRTVDPENSRLLESALKRARVPHRVIFYRKGPHGMGLLDDEERLRFPETAEWSGEMLKFLTEQKILPEAGKRGTNHE